MISKKLSGNGLWESSRMVLPEHRIRMFKHNEERGYKEKPSLHEDELEMLFQNINYSINQREIVSMTVFGVGQDRVINGVVTYINYDKKKLRIEFDDGYEFVDFDEIINVRM
jgi:hypothetical protein